MNEMKALYYFGTSLTEYGHYIWVLDNDMQKIWLKFDRLPFNPEELTRTLNNGEISTYQTTEFTVIAICGSCKDDRPGSKSVFWVNESIPLIELKKIILNTPKAKQIIEAFKFAVKWDDLSQHVQSELSQTNAGYWKQRCEAAEAILNELPHTKQGLSMKGNLLSDWMKLFKTPEPKSALYAKIELIEKELTDKKIRELNPIWVRDEIIKRLKG
jgi:hypothetical protein